MKAIVTGSSGFIGSILCEALLNLGWDVLGLDNHSNYYSTKLKQTRLNKLLPHRNFRFLKFDITHSSELNGLFAKFKPDSVFHLAAQAGVRIPAAELQKYVSSNLVGFSSVLQATVLNEVKNFVYASSSSVYGDSTQIPYSEAELLLKPNSFYGATKLTNEILASSLIPGTATRARALRLFTVYGPQGRPDMAYYKIIKCLLKGEVFDLYGDGQVSRDLTYVRDVVSNIILLERELVNHDVGFYDVVNMGGGNPITMLKLIETCEEICNLKLSINFLEKSKLDSLVTNSNSSYLKSLIGKIQFTSHEEGLNETVKWSKEEIHTPWFCD